MALQQDTVVEFFVQSPKQSKMLTVCGEGDDDISSWETVCKTVDLPAVVLKLKSDLLRLVSCHLSLFDVFSAMSQVDRMCLNCHRVEQTECECPCECLLLADLCTDSPDARYMPGWINHSGGGGPIPT